MKPCTTCKKVKPLTDFYNHVKHGPRPECKACSKERNAKNWKRNKKSIVDKNNEWREVNKDKLAIYTRKQTLRRKYGITPEVYGQMLKSQSNTCAICELASDKILCVDHSHETGKVRALLCNACNTALGLLKEDIKIVESLKRYILEHNDAN